jgi:hypothetical protein
MEPPALRTLRAGDEVVKARLLHVCAASHG